MWRSVYFIVLWLHPFSNALSQTNYHESVNIRQWSKINECRNSYVKTYFASYTSKHISQLKRQNVFRNLHVKTYFSTQTSKHISQLTRQNVFLNSHVQSN